MRAGASDLVLARKAGDSDGEHLDGFDGVVADRLDLRNGGHHVHALDDFAKDGVLRLTAREPVEEGVVGNVDEELGAA
eukprot:scaffold302114_cov21-Tisochrysis_lutea.AAC.2